MSVPICLSTHRQARAIDDRLAEMQAAGIEGPVIVDVSDIAIDMNAVIAQIEALGGTVIRDEPTERRDNVAAFPQIRNGDEN